MKKTQVHPQDIRDFIHRNFGSRIHQKHSNPLMYEFSVNCRMLDSDKQCFGIKEGDANLTLSDLKDLETMMPENFDYDFCVKPPCDNKDLGWAYFTNKIDGNIDKILPNE